MKRIIIILLFLCSSVFTNAQCWKSVSGGNGFTVAVKMDGTLFAWGFNVNGQLGDGTYSNKNIPTQIGYDNNWKSVYAGNSHAFAIKTDGTLWAWGLNYNGQLGDGTYINKNIPTQIGTDNNWQSAAGGDTHSLAIKNDGTLWAWGWNYIFYYAVIKYIGKVGNGSFVSPNLPTQIGTDTNWQSVAAGDAHSLAVKKDGTLWAWGSDWNGQLGDSAVLNGEDYYKNIPTRIGRDSNWQSVSAGYQFSLGVKNNNTAWAWGQDLYGQTGLNRTYWATNIPTQIGTDNNWKDLSAGYTHSTGIKTDGAIWSWGDNTLGELGDGTIVNKKVPIEIGSGADWQAVGAGFYNTFALKNDGSIWACGNNNFGAVGDGTNNTQYFLSEVICPITVLPITLKSITVQKQYGSVAIAWQTAAELNSKEYQIERSTNGIVFNKLSVITSMNNPTGFHYAYIDEHPNTGQNYYRIKSIDLDGSSSYSSIVRIIFNPSENQVTTYPNPLKDYLFIETNFKSKYIKVNITDVAGRNILETVETNNIQIKIPVNNLVPGIYFLTVSDDIQKISKKIIKE